MQIERHALGVQLNEIRQQLENLEVHRDADQKMTHLLGVYPCAVL